MEKRRWKENPKYSEDDLLSRIMEAVGDMPAPVEADYGECAVVNGIPVDRTDSPFKITELSLSPSRLVMVGEEVFEEEKEKLKKSVKAALGQFRSSRLGYLKRLFSEDEDVQKALNKMELSGDLPEILEEAKKRLKDLGFSQEQVNSVGFMPKEKALKFASDDLAQFLKPLISDFDGIFGKLSSFNPGERKKALATVIRAWEEGAEEWETEEKEHLYELSPGLLARLSKSDISFAQQMKNISDSSFRSFSDFDTALGAVVVSGMFPPAALIYLLPVLVPALLDLFFSDLSISRRERSESQKELVTKEMARLFASKAVGNALMTEMAVRLANGESPERLWNDMPKLKNKLRDMFEGLYQSGQKLFGEHSHNDGITPGSAEHLKIADEVREAAKVSLDAFWDERKAKAVKTIGRSAQTEADIANSVKINFTPEGISCSIDSSVIKDAFTKIKFEQADKNLKEYVNHINKIYKGNDDPNISAFLDHYGIVPRPIRIAVTFASDYGIFEDVAGSQSGTTMVETKTILNTIRNLDLNSEDALKGAEIIASDAVVRMLPQELLGYVNNMMKDVNLAYAHYNDEMEKLLNVSAPIEKSFAQVEKELEGVSDKTRKTAGLIFFLAKLHQEDIGDTVSRLFGTKNVRAAAVQFLNELKAMDDSQLNEIAAELYTVFNRTVTEPGILETVKNHEVPFETDETSLEMER